jgi:hypothetical protein
MSGSACSRGGGLAVYVTSHGFGHLNRTAAVLNRVPTDVPITIKSNPNLFDHWRERLRRPAAFQSFISDVGAVNPPGDSAVTDGPATIALAVRVHMEALARLDEEVQRLTKEENAAVFCDAPALPLLAAKRAGIPGFLMTNFTWADIYAPHARRAGADAIDFVRGLREVYRSATATFRVAPALRMSWLSPVYNAGMVVNQVTDRRVELRRYLGLEKADKLVYVYVGRYGQSDLDWPRLAEQSGRGVHFVTYPPLPARAPSNFHAVPSPDWPGGDLIASCDVVFAKAGYGTVCEAMASGTPLVYPPRHGFAEHRSLDRSLRGWGAGVPISSLEFRSLRLNRALERALQVKPGPPPFPPDGAIRIARYLTAICRHPNAPPPWPTAPEAAGK